MATVDPNMTLGQLKTELDSGVDVLVNALEFAEKFDMLFPTLAPEISTGISLLKNGKAFFDALFQLVPSKAA